MTEHQEDYVSNIFDYHDGANIDPIRFKELRESAKSMARCIMNNCGHHRGMDIDRAIDYLRVSLSYAIAAIVIPESITPP
jgi:hypothetical protein